MFVLIIKTNKNMAAALTFDLYLPSSESSCESANRPEKQWSRDILNEALQLHIQLVYV